MIEQRKLFASDFTNISSEKMILEKHKAEWEAFRNAQRTGLDRFCNSFDPFGQTSTPLANLKDFERKRRNRPSKISKKTLSMSMEKNGRTSFRRLNSTGTGFIQDGYKLDKNERLSFAVDADSDSGDAMRIDNFAINSNEVQSRDRQDEMLSENRNEKLLVSQKSISEFAHSSRFNLSHIKGPTTKSRSPTKSAFSNPYLSSGEASNTYSEVLQMWMQDRKTWERCKKEYEVKLKSAEVKMREQSILASMRLHDLERKTADSSDLQEQLEAARGKASEVELLLQTKSDRVNYLEQRCKLLESKEEANEENWSDKAGVIAELKNKLDFMRKNLEEANKKNNPDLKKLKSNLITSKKTVLELKDKVQKQELFHTDLQRKLQFEIQNAEKLNTTITELTNENLLLREEQQRLHLIEVELKNTRTTIKQHEENEKRLQKSNSILTEQLELLEKCNNRFKLEIERKKSESSASKLRQTQQLIPPAASNLSAHKNEGISPFVKNVDFAIPSCKQKASHLKTHIQKIEDPHWDTNGNLSSLSPTYSCFESTKERQKVVTDYPPWHSTQTPAGAQSVHVPLSAISTQLCETDVVFIKSLREMLTSYLKFTAKNKPVETNFHESRKVQKSNLMYSGGMRIRGLSKPNKVKSRKKVSKRNRVKKKKSNTSYATKSKIKLISNTVMANRRCKKAL